MIRMLIENIKYRYSCWKHRNDSFIGQIDRLSSKKKKDG